MKMTHPLIEKLESEAADCSSLHSTYRMGILAAISIAKEYLEQTGWKPIEEAPRTGEWFIIVRENDPDFCEVGRFSPLKTSRYIDVGDGLYKKQEEILYDWDGFSNFHLATHFMPLPLPPAKGTENE